MEKKFISLIEKQIQKLDADGFDLEAWKSSSIALLTRIYGATDLKIEQISKLNIDYSSWALRDSESTYNPLESCKKQGREILEMCLDDIKNFGVPGQSLNESADIVVKILEDELKVSQYKSLNKTLAKSKNNDELLKEIAKWDDNSKHQILSNIFLKLGLKDNL